MTRNRFENVARYDIVCGLIRDAQETGLAFRQLVALVREKHMLAMALGYTRD